MDQTSSTPTKPIILYLHAKFQPILMSSFREIPCCLKRRRRILYIRQKMPSGKCLLLRRGLRPRRAPGGLRLAEQARRVATMSRYPPCDCFFHFKTLLFINIPYFLCIYICLYIYLHRVRPTKLFFQSYQYNLF